MGQGLQGGELQGPTTPKLQLQRWPSSRCGAAGAESQRRLLLLWPQAAWQWVLCVCEPCRRGPPW